MLNEKSEENDKEQILELTDQICNSKEILDNENIFQINQKNIFKENKDDFNKIETLLRESYNKYINEKKIKISQEKIDNNQILGGTLRINKLKFKPYQRLLRFQNFVLVFDLFSTDYKICSKASKML